ncbi:thioesterase domain-containing protein [Cystobacter fuscus]
MADAYVALLETQGIHPPYRLGGSSFGGIVAYHMAGLLARRHGVAPELVLIDSPARGNLPKAMDELETLDYLARYGLGGLPFSRERLNALPSLEEKIQYLAGCARGTAFEDMLSADFLPRFIQTGSAMASSCSATSRSPTRDRSCSSPTRSRSRSSPRVSTRTGRSSPWGTARRSRCLAITSA